MRDKVIAILDKWAISYHPTGSRYICNPAPTDTDEDIVCLATEELKLALEYAGAEADGEPEKYEGMSDFVSMRMGEVNVIVTDAPSFYRRFVAATEEAKAKNLVSKADRIALFQSRLYGAGEEIPL